MTRWLIGALGIIILAGLGLALFSKSPIKQSSVASSCANMRPLAFLINFQDASLKRLPSSEEAVSVCATSNPDPQSTMEIEIRNANNTVVFTQKQTLQEYAVPETFSGDALVGTPEKVINLPVEILVPESVANQSSLQTKIIRLDDKAVVASGAL